MSFKNLHKNIKVRIVERFLNSLVAYMVFPFMIIFFAEVYGGVVAGIMFAINTFITLSVSLYGGIITDRIGRKKIMVYSEYIRFLATIIMVMSTPTLWNSPITIYLMMIISGICSAFSQPASQAMLIDVSTRKIGSICIQ